MKADVLTGLKVVMMVVGEHEHVVKLVPIMEVVLPVVVKVPQVNVLMAILAPVKIVVVLQNIFVKLLQLV
jgi:hypothetical protein